MFFNQYDVKMMREDDKKCISAMLLCLWLSRPSANTCILKHTNEKYVVVFLLKLIIYFWDDNPWNKQLFICQIIGCRKTVLISVTDCWPLERAYCKQHVVALELRKIIKRQRTRDELLVLSDLFQLIRNVQNKCLSPTWKQISFFFLFSHKVTDFTQSTIQPCVVK